MMAWLKAFVPQHLSNMQLLNILDFCTHFKICKKRIKANSRANIEVLSNGAPTGKGVLYTKGKYIENQSQWKPVKFGRYTMAYSGCEIIATYNAILSLGEKLPEQGIADFISIYERKGAALCGGWGVAPRAIYWFFRERGYEAVLSFSKDSGDINKMGEEYRTVIVTVYNDGKDITKQIHTMNVSKDDKGCYIVHNCYRMGRNGSYVMGMPYASLYEAIKSLHGGAAMPICIIGINPMV